MATAWTILRAAGLTERDIQPVYLKPADAAAALREGQVDAWFEVAAAPSALIADLAQAIDIDLLPIPLALAERLRQSVPFYAAATIAAGRYRDVEETETASFGTMWVVTSDTDDKTVYELTRALLHPSNRRALDQGNPLGRLIRPDTVLDGVSVQLHPGAAQYYREAGLLKA